MNIDRDDKVTVAQHHEGSMEEDAPPASINTIPVEILTEIFGYFLPKGNVLDPSVSPLVTFVSVCRHWRHASLNTPYLWSTIRMYNPRPSRIQMLHQWLERSKTCPLSLMLEITPFSSEDRAEWQVLVKTMEEILFILIRYLHRWRSVDIRVDEFPIHRKSPLLMFPRCPRAAPLLERVSIRDIGSFTLDAGESLWKTIGGYQSVRRVAWRTGVDGPRACLTELVAWNHITHLSSHFVLSDEFLDLLSRLQALEDLHILALGESSSPSTARRRICLPRLGRFSILSSTHPVTSSFLDHIALPQLKSLRLGELHSGDPWISMLHHSSCQVKTFALRGRSASNEGLTQLLSCPAMGRLKELSVVLRCNADGLLKFLTCSSEVPRLPFLCKMNMSLGGFTNGLLSGMLNSRLLSTPSVLAQLDLILVSARACGDIRADMCFLKQLRESGFDVTYR
ncbi:hypothetical protein PM082_010265 [Marasmius tenuissimus]|nr:hypothetical protein PM082_010265 [Marasmius tenuissimus]